MFFTWEHRLDIAQQSPPIVPVDLVTIASKTNIAPAIRSAPKIAFQPPQPQVQPEALDRQIPLLPREEAETSPSKQTPSQPALEAPPPPVIVPKMRPEPVQKSEQKKSGFNIDSVLALLNKVTPQQAQSTSAKTAATPRRGVGNPNLTTADLATILFNEIKPCWNPPVGAPSADDIIVTYSLLLNPDGTVARADADASAVVAETRTKAAFANGRAGNAAPNLSRNDSFKAAAAKAAERAIYDCQPYKLPADRYAQWRAVTIVFDPSQMMGQ